ncbi:RNA-directed DNA polymerase, eukaryota, reverse transcriptase zinc-binding domain protein, partial [Tanacetum coccineum]
KRKADKTTSKEIEAISFFSFRGELNQVQRSSDEGVMAKILKHPLTEIVSYKDLYSARLQANMTVKDFVEGSNGHCPKEWSSKFPLITQMVPIILKLEQIDTLMWRSNSGTMGKFYVKQTYYDIQNNGDNVSWSKLIWYSENIPKHALILWLAIQGNLTTQDKVRKWGSFDLMLMENGRGKNQFGM